MALYQVPLDQRTRKNTLGKDSAMDISQYHISQ